MPMAFWLVAVLVASLLVFVPRIGYSGVRQKHNFGSAFGIILIICLIVILLGRV